MKCNCCVELHCSTVQLPSYVIRFFVRFRQVNHVSFDVECKWYISVILRLYNHISVPCRASLALNVYRGAVRVLSQLPPAQKVINDEGEGFTLRFQHGLVLRYVIASAHRNYRF
jgi:hypothetical protein